MSDEKADGRGCPPGSNRGGGPKTGEGKETALANLRNDTNLTHGAYAFLSSGTFPPCDGCGARSQCPLYDAGGQCSVVREIYLEELRQVKGVKHIQETPVIAPLVDIRARTVAIMAKVNIELGQTGYFRHGEKGIEPQPLLEFYLRLGSRLEQTSVALGLTPKSAFQLSLDLGGSGIDAVAQRVRELEEKARREQEPAIDGEFEKE